MVTRPSADPMITNSSPTSSRFAPETERSGKPCEVIGSAVGIRSARHPGFAQRSSGRRSTFQRRTERPGNAFRNLH